jgi:hypothetical protein
MNTNFFYDDDRGFPPLAPIREYSCSFVAEIPLSVTPASFAFYCRANDAWR